MWIWIANEFAKFHAKRLNRSENIPQSFFWGGRGTFLKQSVVPHRIIWSWYVGPPRPLLAVPNVTAHPSTASVPIAVLLYNGPLLCGFNVVLKGLSASRRLKSSISRHHWLLTDDVDITWYVSRDVKPTPAVCRLLHIKRCTRALLHFIAVSLYSGKHFLHLWRSLNYTMFGRQNSGSLADRWYDPCDIRRSSHGRSYNNMNLSRYLSRTL